MLAGALVAGLLGLTLRGPVHLWLAERERDWGALAAAAPPDELARALAGEPPEVRGEWHAALSRTQDPTHIPAILAYAERHSLRLAHERPAIIESLRRFGPAGEPALRGVLERRPSPLAVSLAAEALNVPDPGATEPLTPERR